MNCLSHLAWFLFRVNLPVDWAINLRKSARTLNKSIGICSHWKCRNFYRLFWKMHRSPWILNALVAFHVIVKHLNGLVDTRSSIIFFLKKNTLLVLLRWSIVHSHISWFSVDLINEIAKSHECFTPRYKSEGLISCDVEVMH